MTFLAEGRITRLSHVEEAGNTIVYFSLEQGSEVYRIDRDASDATRGIAALLKAGDFIALQYEPTDGSMQYDHVDRIPEVVIVTHLHVNPVDFKNSSFLEPELGSSDDDSSPLVPGHALRGQIK